MRCPGPARRGVRGPQGAYRRGDLLDRLQRLLGSRGVVLIGLGLRIGENHPTGAEEALQAVEERMLAERVQLRTKGAALPRAAAREQHMGWHAAAPPEVELRGGVVLYVSDGYS